MAILVGVRDPELVATAREALAACASVDDLRALADALRDVAAIEGADACPEVRSALSPLAALLALDASERRALRVVLSNEGFGRASPDVQQSVVRLLRSHPTREISDALIALLASSPPYVDGSAAAWAERISELGAARSAADVLLISRFGRSVELTRLSPHELQRVRDAVAASAGPLQALDSVLELVRAPCFATLDADRRGVLLDALSSRASVASLVAVASQASFAHLPVARARAVLSSIAEATDEDAATAGAIALLAWPGVDRLGAESISHVIRIAAARGGEALTLLDPLLNSESFTALGQAQRAAVLAQVANYADSPTALAFLTRFIECPSFRRNREDLANLQAALKLMAFAGWLFDAPGGDDRLIRATVERIFSDDLSLSFRPWLSGGSYGETVARIVYVRRLDEAGPADANDPSRVLDAGNGPCPQGAGLWALDTLAHEVNHGVDNIGRAEAEDAARVTAAVHPQWGTWDNFVSEYRGWCVGYRATHGRWPDRAGLLAIINEIIGGARSYGPLHDAAQGDSPLAAQILELASAIAGQPVTLSFARSAEEGALVFDPARVPDAPFDPYSTIGDAGDIDN